LRWLWARFWVAAFVVSVGMHVYPRVRNLVLGVEITAARRGHQIALRSGCFTCHGPNGTGGVKNPGSEDGEVPGFAGGTPMMWAKSEQELREYILDGAPQRKRQDPRFKEAERKQLFAMPAFRGFLSDHEVDDLVSFIGASSGLIVPKDEVAAQGQDLAYRLGCFQCHGPMGTRGPGNLGSLKGYIPGWWGRDFHDLVRNDEELRAWILDGQIERLRDNAIARHFIESQRIYMPAYRDFIDDKQLEALIRYVRWVSGGEWQGKPLDLGH
jgi:mono/diheme cytochrome c family protein